MKVDISNVTAIALNERGAKTAVSLGLTVEIGKPSSFLDEHWNAGECLVAVMALPIVVRLLAKKRLDKENDPVIVVIDESGKFVIPMLGGHRGANRLATELAARSSSTAVITTASDNADISAIDGLSGFAAIGDVAGLIESMLDGRDPVVEHRISWPAPIRLNQGVGPAKIIISDTIVDLESSDDPLVQLIPPSLVLGIGCSSDASASDIKELTDLALAQAGLDRRAVSAIATLDIRATHPALLAQGVPVISYSSAILNEVDVPTPSDHVEGHVGTKSVCEAAALLTSRNNELLVTKVKNERVTLAVARRQPMGSIKVVGLGPGSSMMRTPGAIEAIVSSEVVVGYHAYVDQCAELLSPHQLVVRSPIGDELERASSALGHALSGRSVAIVCSGDPEVFAMASITFEAIESYCLKNDVVSIDEVLAISVIPGVTAGLGGGALLGAPLGHDHAYLSLSDLLTPWETIEKRIVAFGQADVAIVIYNPQSRTRIWQLPRAIELLSKFRKPETPIAIVRNVGRPGESKTITTLDSFESGEVDMTSLVIVGSSTTRRFGDYMFTPRGYEVTG